MKVYHYEVGSNQLGDWLIAKKNLQRHLEMETASICKCLSQKKGDVQVDKLNREVLRMELQVSELIRVVANLNERLRKLEDIGDEGMYFAIHRYPEKI